MNRGKLAGIVLLVVILMGSGLPISQAAPQAQTAAGPVELAVWDKTTGDLTIMQRDIGQIYKVHFGQQGDIPVPGYYYGPLDDGNPMVFAVWRPSNGTWYISKANPFGTNGLPVDLEIQLGKDGDTPVPADYDGDGTTDLAVWDESTGIWTMLLNGTEVQAQVGQQLDIPIPGDYDGDGTDEIAVYRTSAHEFYVSLDNTDWGAGPTLTVTDQNANQQQPLVGAIDSDPNDDMALWNSSQGVFTVLEMDNSNLDTLTFATFQTGMEGDIPVLADFNGDGRDEAGVWRPKDGNFYVNYTQQDWTSAPADELATYSLAIVADTVPVPGQYWIESVR